MWLGQIDKNFCHKEINIVGAGISGLLLGHYLKRHNIPFVIWENSQKVGGKLGSISTPFGLVETAANALILDSNVFELTQQLKLPILYSNTPLKRWIDQGKIPFHWLSGKKILFQFLWALLFKGHHKITINSQLCLKDFFSPLMGEKWSSSTLSAMTRGIYAKEAEALSLDALFPIKFLVTLKSNRMSYFSFFFSLLKYKKKLKLSQKNAITSVSFKNGLQDLIDALHIEIKDHIRLNTDLKTITTILEKQSVVFCTSPLQAAKILEVCDRDLSNILKMFTLENVQSTTIFTNKQIPKLKNSFGVLLTPQVRTSFFGILAQSEIFKYRTKSPDHHCYTLIGPIYEVSTIISDFLNYSKLNPQNILETTTHLWHQAIPLYDKNRQIRALELNKNLENKSFVFFGNYIEAIGLKDLVRGAKELADNIKLLK